MQRGLLVVCASALLLTTSAFVTVMSAPRVAEAGVRVAVVAILKGELRQKFGPVVDRVAPGGLAQLEVQQRVASAGELLEGPLPDALGELLARQCRYESCAGRSAAAPRQVGKRSTLRPATARLER